MRDSDNAAWKWKEIKSLNQVEPKMMGGGLNEAGGLYFWSWSLKQETPETTRSFFIFHTAKYLRADDVIHALKDAHREWLVDKLGKPIPVPYTLSHAFEVHTRAPIRWRDFIDEVKRALKPIL